MIGSHDGFLCLLDHRAGKFRLFEVIVHKTTVFSNTADRQDRVVDVELAHKVDCRGAEGGPVVRAHCAAANMHPVARFAHQRACDFGTVGDYRQVAMIAERTGDVGRGGAGVQHNGVAVADDVGDQPRNQQFLFDLLVHAFCERRLGFLVLAEHDPAVDFLDQTLAYQRLDIAADGFIGHIKLGREFDDRAGTAGFYRSENFVLSLVQAH